ncbi:MAG: CapA family protein [Fimbriimonadaceae bacterium]|nr:CapA family protein [Fimbriimonadaceae bacterium]QYK56798.1 MAG: CapA family protein [Fimbriimonadaceae bacterium]
MTVFGAYLALAQSWSMVAVGDVMLNAVTPSSRTFEGIAPVVRQADIAYANLEIPLTRARTSTNRKNAAELKARTQFVLKADPGHAKPLAEAGFDVVSLANNHAMDYGKAGLDEMLRLLDQNKVKWCGAGRNLAEAERAAVLKAPNGPRVAFVSYLAFVSTSALWKCGPATQDTAGIATLDLGGTVGARQEARLRTIVQNARRQADLVIVALHWGDERKTLPKPYQVELGRAFVRAGADAVIGAHPHVLQPYEFFQGKPILYSMGNAVSPLPAHTAVARLRFRDRVCEGVEMLPASIKGGRVTLLPGTAKAFGSLNAQFQKRYPHEKSRTTARR